MILLTRLAGPKRRYLVRCRCGATYVVRSQPSRILPERVCEPCKNLALRQEKCHRGHVIAENEYVDGKGRRHCGACRLERQRQRRRPQFGA